MAEHAAGGEGIRGVLATFGINLDTHELKEGGEKLNNFVGQLKELGEAIATAFAVEKIYEFAEANAHAMAAIEHTSQILGISTDRVQEFQFAAKSLGLEADQLLTSIGKLETVQGQAAAGGSKQAAEFSKMGVAIHDANGKLKSSDELFLDVADSISKMEDPSKAAAAAVGVFGKQGRVLLPFLKEGRKGFEELSEGFKELGGGYTEKAIEESAKFEKETARVDLALTSLKSTILVKLYPALVWVQKGVEAVVKWFRDLTKNSEIVKAALIVLTGVATYFAVQTAIAFAPVIAIAAGLAFLVGVLDDLIVMFEGGDSLTGEWLDKAFGKGTSVEIVKQLSDAWHSIVETFKELAPVLKEAWGYYSKFVEAGLKPLKLLGKVGEFLGDKAFEADRYITDKQIEQRDNYNRPSIKPPSKPRIDFTPLAASLPAPAWQGPVGAPGSGVSMQPQINQTIVAAPGMDEKALGDHAGKAASDALKRSHKDAAANLQRAPTPEGT